MPQTRRFTLTNRLPPTLKPRKHFTSTPRKVCGHLIQCRTGHGYLGEYYVSFVPTEPTSCLCGDPRPTREHILRDCPLFTQLYLREVSHDIILNEILGTEKGPSKIHSGARRFQEGCRTRTRKGPR
ncbi:hypothetical protein BDR03DRAFT_956343 [Suillus americanus]|nr:hypothetical protein BDR03DRAFT_956343 [Suillus americanus]